MADSRVSSLSINPFPNVTHDRWNSLWEQRKALVQNEMRRTGLI